MNIRKSGKYYQVNNPEVDYFLDQEEAEQYALELLDNVWDLLSHADHQRTFDILNNSCFDDYIRDNNA